MSLGVEEFVRRFLLHVLPRGLTRIRHYGLLACRGRRQRLWQCRRLVERAQAEAAEASAEAAAEAAREAEAGPAPPAVAVSRVSRVSVQARCPHCRRGRLLIVWRWPPGSPAPPGWEAAAAWRPPPPEPESKRLKRLGEANQRSDYGQKRAA